MNNATKDFNTRSFISDNSANYDFVGTKIHVFQGINNKLYLGECIVTMSSHTKEVCIHNTSPIGMYLRKLKKLIKGFDVAIDAIDEFNALPQGLLEEPKRTNGIYGSRGYQAFLNPLDSTSGGTMKALIECRYTEARDGEGVMRYNTCVNGIVDVSDCTRKIRYVVKQNDNLKNIRNAIQLHYETLVEIKKTLLGKTYKPGMLD